jgi:hypothetical protein
MKISELVQIEIGTCTKRIMNSKNVHIPISKGEVALSIAVD